MKKWIAAAVVVVIVIAAAVWYKAGSAPAVAETPETAATPAPTATPEATPAATPVSDEGLQYEFDLYVETYKYDNSLTDEQLNDEATKVEMFKWIYDCGYSAGQADEEKADGCTNALLPEYVEWCSTDANEYIVEDNAQNGTTQNTDGLTQEQIDAGLHYDEEGLLVDANGNYSMEGDDDLYEHSDNGITDPNHPASNEKAHEAGLAIHEMFNGEQAQEKHAQMAEILGRG